MNEPKLDISSFVKAHASLVDALDAKTDDKIQAVLNRDAAIQRFEYTYELAYKMLKRFLEITSHNPDTIDELGFRDILRVGGEVGLIDDVSAWFDFREKRNITSHAYDEAKAKEIFATIPAFAAASGKLLTGMQSRLAQ
jgi:nucleotidyltransferase substrate binding protein (TIGR01987 family)